MANYVEYIKVGSGESWPVRDVEAQNSITNINTEVDNLKTTITTLDEVVETEVTRLDGLISALLLQAHPVGSFYISEDSTSPNELFGGTWEQVKDMFLLAAGDTYTAGTTGGESTHTLTEDEMPSHAHTAESVAMLHPSSGTYKTGTGGTGTVYLKNFEGTTEATGGGEAHNNMPPYLTVYVWKRTA